MPTCTVTGTLRNSSGVALPNTPVSFLRGGVFAQAGAVILERLPTTVSDAFGEISIDLLPGVYLGIALDYKGSRDGFQVGVPDAPTADLADIIDQAVEITPSILALAVAARDAAIEAADRVDLGALDDAVAATAADRLQTGLDRISTSIAADVAEAAKDAAEAAKDAAAVNANVYISTLAGFAATAVGDQFQVLAPDGSEVVRYRHDAGPTATEVARYPAASTVSSARLLVVAGDGAAYTSTTTGGASAYQNGALVLFRPNVEPTVQNPTLSVNGGPAQAILRPNGGPRLGFLRSAQTYMLVSLGGNWRIVNDFGNTSLLFNFAAGGPTNYTLTAPPGAGRASLDTVILFSVPVANAGDCNISINGGTNLSLRDSDFQTLPAGTLVPNAYYAAFITPAAAVLLNFRPRKTADDLAALEVKTENKRLMADAHQARYLSMHTNPLVVGGGEKERILMFGSGTGYRGYAVSFGDLGRTIRSGTAGAYIDLRNLGVGASDPIMVDAVAQTKLVTASAIHTAAAGTLVRIFRTEPAADGFVFDVVKGAVTLEADSNDNPPARDFSFIMSGQSLAARFIEGAGLHGFQKGLRDYGSDVSTMWGVNGAIGSTGLVPASGAVFWWNPVTNEPGPAALNWKDKLDAIPSTQPAPAFGYHVFGQNDAQQMGNDPTLTVPAYLASYQALFAWMRAQVGNANWPIFISPVARWDFAASPTNAQISAVRWVELELINSDANVHLGPWYYDLPLPHYDVHLNIPGQMYQGYRLAPLYRNALLGASHPTGTRISALTENSGTNWTIRISNSDPTNPFHVPENLGHIGFFGSGEDPLTATPAKVLTQSWQPAGGDRLLTVTLDRSVSGGQLIWPYGAMEQSRQGMYPVDVRMTPTNQGWGNHWPLRPFKGGAFS